jgi:hypothetical protein
VPHADHISSVDGKPPRGGRLVGVPDPMTPDQPHQGMPGWETQPPNEVSGFGQEEP